MGEECDAEVWSWDYFSSDQTDPYWIRCTWVIPHTTHGDDHTGLTWVDNTSVIQKTHIRKALPLMFNVYKPKGDRVKAAEITLDTVVDLSKLFMGRIVQEPADWSSDDDKQPGSGRILAFEYPTFSGIKSAEIGMWVVQKDDGSYEVMKNEDFTKNYELAYKSQVRNAS